VPPQEDSNLLQMRRCLFFLRSKNLKSTRLKRRGITKNLNIRGIIVLFSKPIAFKKGVLLLDNVAIAEMDIIAIAMDHKK